MPYPFVMALVIVAVRFSLVLDFPLDKKVGFLNLLRHCFTLPCHLRRSNRSACSSS